jgi:MFS family permease
MYMIGCVFVAVFGFIYFALLNTKLPALIFVAVALSGLPIMTMYGPEAALIAESFSPRLRYSGSSLGYQLASIIAGGSSPFIATALLAAFASSFPIALYILGCAVIGIAATALLTDYANKDISEETTKSSPLAVYRYDAVCHLSVELPDRPLFPRLRGDRSRLGVAVDRLHEQGRLTGIRRRLGRHESAGTTKTSINAPRRKSDDVNRNSRRPAFRGRAQPATPSCRGREHGRDNN